MSKGIEASFQEWLRWKRAPGEIARCDAALAQLDSELADLRSSITSAEDEVESLRRAVITRMAERQILNDVMSDADAELGAKICDLTARRQELQGKLTTLRNRQHEKTKAFAPLRSERKRWVGMRCPDSGTRDLVRDWLGLA